MDKFLQLQDLLANSNISKENSLKNKQGWRIFQDGRLLHQQQQAECKKSWLIAEEAAQALHEEGRGGKSSKQVLQYTIYNMRHLGTEKIVCKTSAQAKWLKKS